MMRYVCLVALFACSAMGLFAFGSGEQAEKPLLEKSWLVAITEFDVSGLPPSQAVTGAVIARQLTDRLSGLDYRLRDVKEYDYHWTAAWLRAQTVVAKQIAEKRAQRDKLAFAGYADWRYEREAEKIDVEIAELHEKLDAAELDSPEVATIPRFMVTEDNAKGIFPAPPAPGGEYFFCADNKTNGLLRGKVLDFHGRLLVEVELWTVWTRSYAYKDNIVFSIEDIDRALYELTTKLINSMSGMGPAELIVSAEPAEAAIIVDDILTGDKGKTPTIQRTPGPVEVTVYADKFIPATETLELNAGERVDMAVKLNAIPTGSYTVDTATGEPASVYEGSEYVGETPLTLKGPLGSHGQVSVQTEDNRSAQSIFEIVDRSTVTLDPKVPPPSDRTEKARKSFYGAFGRFWIGFPVAFVLWGISGTYIQTYNIARDAAHFDQANTWQWVSIGAWIGFGVLLLDVLVRFAIYIYQGNRAGAILSPKESAEPAPLSLQEAPAAPPAPAPAEGP